MRSSLLVTGSGHSTSDHVTCYFNDTCCHRQEIPASRSSGWYRGSQINDTFMLTTAPIPVSGGGMGCDILGCTIESWAMW